MQKRTVSEKAAAFLKGKQRMGLSFNSCKIRHRLIMEQAVYVVLQNASADRFSRPATDFIPTPW